MQAFSANGNQHQGGSEGNGTSVPPMTSEAEILHEAKMLREHKDRLESRMRLLEVHNKQLEMQLGKLRQLLNAPGNPNDAQLPQGSSNTQQIANGLTITSNKTGTLNTKAVTASQLATNSPILPHKMNGNNAPAPPNKGEPPALPPRGVSIRNNGNKPPPPAVPPKRSSLTRSDLALFSAENVSEIVTLGFFMDPCELLYLFDICLLLKTNQSILQNRTNSLPRRENGGQSFNPTPRSSGSGRDFSLTRMSSLGNSGYNGQGGHWTDSLPRRDFYSNIAPTGKTIQNKNRILMHPPFLPTGSLPRRDKAGLGRPEPPRPPSATPALDNGMKSRRRDLSLNRGPSAENSTSSFSRGGGDAFSGNKGKPINIVLIWTANRCRPIMTWWARKMKRIQPDVYNLMEFVEN